MKWISVITGDELQEDLAREYETAEKAGPVRIGSENLFWGRWGRVFVLPFGHLAGAQRRSEEALASTCCCKTTFSTEYLILRMRDGSDRSIRFDRGDEVERALLLIGERNPGKEIGEAQAVEG